VQERHEVGRAQPRQRGFELQRLVDGLAHELLDDRLAPRAERALAEAAAETFHAGDADAAQLARVAVEHRKAGVGENPTHLIGLPRLDVVVAEHGRGRNPQCSDFLREDARLNAAERDAAVGDLIDLVVAVDGILQAQARADASYFESIAGRRYDDAQRSAIGEGILKAYRWQYIVTGVTEPRFQKVLFGVLDDTQAARVTDALQPLLYAVPARSPMAPLQ